MTRFNYTVVQKSMLGDLYTPVSAYLRLRDLYTQSALMESSDYHGGENGRSFIGVCPVAQVSISHGQGKCVFPDGSVVEHLITKEYRSDALINQFLDALHLEGNKEAMKNMGLFGFTSFNAVRYFEDINVKDTTLAKNDAPDMIYILYKYVVVFDHFRNSLSINELVAEHEEPDMERIEQAMNRLSRRFIQKYEGDDFKLYRALRSINPSPYLFYFDFGGFRIFGSSPETHCRIENRDGEYVAYIDPIAGTTKRTGNDELDKRNAEFLRIDPKENAEHVMLVDLARNDLSRNCHNVKVDFYKDLQYYSHVIHLVSRVSGELDKGADPIKAFIDTFPAGTLSGAPKVRAMQLISEYEPHNRGAYGGCIGFIGFDKSLNQAITIRTFVSRNNELWFQAGGGIVAKSNEEYELQEVNNKLGALRRAILMAEDM